MSEMSLADRTRRLLDEAHHLTLATASGDGRPWAATLHYAWLEAPLRFLFCSVTGARHSRHVAAAPEVSGSLFTTGRPTGVAIAPVEGAQFTGVCRPVPDDQLEQLHAAFFAAVLPDPEARAAWMLPLSALRPPSDHRLYQIEVERWWLIDLSTWARDRVDRRVEMPLGALEAGEPTTEGKETHGATRTT